MKTPQGHYSVNVTLTRIRKHDNTGRTSSLRNRCRAGGWVREAESLKSMSKHPDLSLIKIVCLRDFSAFLIRVVARYRSSDLHLELLLEDRACDTSNVHVHVHDSVCLVCYLSIYSFHRGHKQRAVQQCRCSIAGRSLGGRGGYNLDFACASPDQERRHSFLGANQRVQKIAFFANAPSNLEVTAA